MSGRKMKVLRKALNAKGVPTEGSDLRIEKTASSVVHKNVVKDGLLEIEPVEIKKHVIVNIKKTKYRQIKKLIKKSVIAGNL